MLKTTIGQLLINQALPPDMRDYTIKLDKKGTAKLFQTLAEKYPEEYRAVSKKLMDIGGRFAAESGGFSFGIHHLKTPTEVKTLKEELKKNVYKIIASDLPDKEKQQKIIQTVVDKTKELETKTYDITLSSKNPLALQVYSGARGNPGNLRSLISGDMLYEDHHGRPIPVPVLRSYSQGLTPVEYWAGSFGARKGIVDLKSATSDAGYFCLAKGTLVRMADGSSKEIENIKIGDVVLGSDYAGLTQPTKVINTFNQGLKQIYEYHFYNESKNIVICATEQHKVLSFKTVDKNFTFNCFMFDLFPLSEVDYNFYMVVNNLLFDKSLQNITFFLFDKKINLGQIETFDIEVDHPDNLFVLANGAIVSNSKQLNQVSHRLIVTKEDADQPDENIRGLPVPTDDPDNEGALLAIDTGGYKRNTILTPKILAHLKAQGLDRILIRSPIVGGNPDGGLYSKDVGVRERGGLAPVGDNVGFAAAQALGEQATQAQIGSKHTGGVAGAGKSVAGFKTINQLAQVPKTFTGGAAHAQVDGRVNAVYNAPAGGKYILIGNERHFVAAGFEPKVKIGDIVEAGDILSDGLPNPAEIVKHKGIGEGRRYFTDLFKNVYRESGLTAHRRNVELLSRGLINHVILDEEAGDFLPEDIVPYDVFEHTYKPRDGHSVIAAKDSVNQYLEKPVLHYSIGTKIKPSMIKEFEQFGVKNVITHKEPPPFQPIMIRAMENLLYDSDWMTRQLGSNLKRGLLEAVHRGRKSDELGTSYVPGLARGVDFGRIGLTKSWSPATIKKVNLNE